MVPAEQAGAYPLVSVIIPTFNRRAELAGLLECLGHQTMPERSFEIIVVDDGSTDDTRAFLRARAEKGETNLRFCTQENSGPGAARNRGMRMARAPLYAFTDTDCRPYPDWLEVLTACLGETGVGAVGGAEAAESEAGPLAAAIHFCMTSVLTTGGMRGRSGMTLARYYPRTFNMAITREAFRQTGGFRALFHGEDVELSFRIRQAGFVLRYSDAARVCHKRRQSLKAFFAQVFHMGEARVTLARLHPQLLEPAHVFPAAALIAGAALAGLAYVRPFFIPFLAAGGGAALLVFVGAGCAAVKKTGNAAQLFCVPCAFACQQLAYGCGLVCGLLKWLLCNRRPPATVR